MSERDIGTEILDGLRDVKAFKAGKVDLRVRVLKEPSSAQEIRNELGLSQSAFAGMIIDGCQPENGSRVGTGSPGAKRPGKITAAHC